LALTTPHVAGADDDDNNDDDDDDTLTGHTRTHSYTHSRTHMQLICTLGSASNNNNSSNRMPNMPTTQMPRQQQQQQQQHHPNVQNQATPCGTQWELVAHNSIADFSASQSSSIKCE